MPESMKRFRYLLNFTLSCFPGYKLGPVAISFGDGCAWRSVYIYRISTGRKIAHFSIDPCYYYNASGRPEFSGSILSFTWRIPIPMLLPWNRVSRFFMDKEPELYFIGELYHLETAFWGRMDGRRNWDSKRDYYDVCDRLRDANRILDMGDQSWRRR